MDLSHLSDEQIQIYLDKTDQGKRAEIERHLHNCKHCTRKLQIYQGIYRQLSQDTLPGPAKNFSSLVLTRIKASQDEKTNFWENILFITLLVLGVVGSSYLINPLPLLKSMIEPIADVLARTLQLFPVPLNSTLVLIAGGIFILIFYELLNKRLLKFKS